MIPKLEPFIIPEGKSGYDLGGLNYKFTRERFAAGEDGEIVIRIERKS